MTKGCTYQKAWTQLVDLLRMPSVRSNMHLLLYWEENFPCLVMRTGSDNTLTLRNIFCQSHEAQVRACARWREQQFAGMSKDAVLKRMEELRCWLLEQIYASQRLWLPSHCRP